MSLEMGDIRVSMTFKSVKKNNRTVVRDLTCVGQRQSD